MARWFTLTLSRSSSNAKVIGQSSRTQNEDVPFQLKVKVNLGNRSTPQCGLTDRDG